MQEPLVARSPSAARLPALALLSLVAACGAEPQPEPLPRRVILITCDTLRADRLGVYGYDAATSPNLDALAHDGVVFERCFSSASMTVPAMAGLLTGKLPDEIGVRRGNDSLLSPELTLLPEVLARAGYATGAVVSNWVLRQRNKADDTAGFRQGFQHFDDELKERELNRNYYDRVAADTTRGAVAWLEAQQKAGTDKLFLWVHYQDPHGPYTPPAEFVRAGTGDKESKALPLGRTNLGKKQIPAYQRIGDETSAAFYRERYDGEIRCFDHALGELFDWLRSGGLYDDALIVFSADHGESLGEHGFWFCHGENVFLETVRVPLIVRAPKGSRLAEGLARGATRDEHGFLRRTELASHLDVVPTVLGAQATSLACRGQSLAAPLPAERFLIQVVEGLDHPERWIGVTDDGYRLLRKPPREARLYRYGTDPAERRDLAAEEPERVRAMTEVYDRLMAEAERLRPARAAHRAPTAEELEIMNALGYSGETEDEDEHASQTDDDAER